MTARDLEIIKMRLVDGASLEALADKFEISIERVRQIIDAWQHELAIYLERDKEIKKRIGKEPWPFVYFHDLSPRVQALLKSHGIQTLDAVTEYSASELLRLKGCGRKMLLEIAALLRMNGLKLKDERVGAQGTPHLTKAWKIDTEKGYVLYEDSETRDFLDRCLTQEFWPLIRKSLSETGYQFFPQKTPVTEFVFGRQLERSITFMLFDADRFEFGPRAFFKGELKLSKIDWMLSRDFWLPLSKDTNPEVLFGILANSRFAGLPPTLSMDRKNDNDFFHIDFHAGDGEGGMSPDVQYVADKIKKVIDVNVRMYEFAKDGISPHQIGEFLTIVYEAYEAY